MEKDTYLVRVGKEEILHIHSPSQQWQRRTTECGIDYGPDHERRTAHDFPLGKGELEQFVGEDRVCLSCLRGHQSRIIFESRTRKGPVVAAPSFSAY